MSAKLKKLKLHLLLTCQREEISANICDRVFVFGRLLAGDATTQWERQGTMTIMCRGVEEAGMEKCIV